MLFTKNEAIISDLSRFTINSNKVIQVVKRNRISGLYSFILSKSEKPLSSKVSKEINPWHQRLVHTNIDVFKGLHQTVSSFPKLKSTLHPCHPCLLGKEKKNKFNSHFKLAEYVGETVHSDLCEKMLNSNNRNKYFCTFTDQFSRFSHVVVLKSKSEKFELYDTYQKLACVKKYFPKGVKRLNFDGGGEYFNYRVSPIIPKHTHLHHNATTTQSLKIALSLSPWCDA